MQKVDNLKIKMISCIKSQRNKVFIGYHNLSQQLCIIKIMMFSLSQKTEYLEEEIFHRLIFLQQINKKKYLTNYFSPFQIYINENNQHKIIYMIKKYNKANSFAKIIKEGNFNKQSKISNTSFLRQIIKKLFLLIIQYQDLKGFIFTLQNLLVRQDINLQGQQQSNIQVNLMSFSELRLLKLKKSIQIDQFQQIGIFLDQKSIRNGQIDSVSFRFRNIAIIMVCLIAGKDLSEYVFQGSIKQNIISPYIAQNISGQNLRNKLNKVVQFQRFKKQTQKIGIDGLQDFIKNAINNSDSCNLAQVKDLIFHKAEKGFLNISESLWRNSSEPVEEKMLNYGVSNDSCLSYYLIKEDSSYAAETSAEELVQTFKNESLSYQKNVAYQKIAKMILKNENAQMQQIGELKQLALQNYMNCEYYEGRQIYNLTQQYKMLNQYDF